MNEIINAICKLGLKQENKDFIIEVFEKEVDRLKFLIKDNEFNNTVEDQVFVVSLSTALDKLMSFRDISKDERLSILLIDDVNITIFKRRLSEIDQILQEKGL